MTNVPRGCDDFGCHSPEARVGQAPFTAGEGDTVGEHQVEARRTPLGEQLPEDGGRVLYKRLTGQNRL
ncbi:hypothetical protein GTZ89_18730 [Streptomyces sp. SID8382]|uniref:hypothetical protein n=1 Tax=Streptomyces TaxID=1883 RepID=UPI0013311D54|nr:MULTISPECIES: hypothetical protein [unclassified Streptomyces]MYX57653.1 hypothetical protein [Streptomyces sp. SID8382]